MADSKRHTTKGIESFSAMNNIRLEEECIHCVIDKFAGEYPDTISYSEKISYIKGVLRIIEEAKETESAPELVERINLLQKKMFGKSTDYSAIKKHFNSLILSMEEDIYNRIRLSDDPLLSSIRYAMTGNYIDFGAMDSVDEDELFSLIDASGEISLDMTEAENLRKELGSASRIAILTDNCGEIVFDKLMIRTIKDLYPSVEIDVIVRGYPVLNDATMEDADMTGISDYAHVTDNGTGVAGTVIDQITNDARDIIDRADLVLSKGQGNFETLRYCGRNVYYIFMCKCPMFAERFGVERFSPMLLNDRRLNV